VTPLRVFRDWAGDAPDEITALVNLTIAPPLPVIPEEWHGKKVAALIAASTGPVDDGDVLVRALRDVAEPIADLLGPMPYHVIQTLIDPLWAKGIHSYFKATNLARLDDALVDRLCEIHLAAPGPQCEIHVHQMGGAVGRVTDGATAFTERSMPFVLDAVTGWHDPGVSTARREWARTRDREPSFGEFRIVAAEGDCRVLKLRDVMTRFSMPFGFYPVESDAGRRLVDEAGLDATRLPVVQSGGCATRATGPLETRRHIGK
jgi:hypothetical protein